MPRTAGSARLALILPMGLVLILALELGVRLLTATHPQQVESLLESELGVPVETVNAAVPGFAGDNARPLFDDREARAHFTDGCHMTAAGTRRIARAIVDAIRAKEAERPSLSLPRGAPRAAPTRRAG